MSWGVRRPAAALAFLTLVAGCGSGSGTGAPSSQVTTIVQSTESEYTLPIITTTTTPAAATASPTPAPGTRDFGYVSAVDSSSPPVLEFDRALFLTGAAADKASAAHGGESPVPNDYFIVNDNPLLRKLALAPGVQIVGSLQLNSFVTKDDYSNTPKKHALKDLLAFLATAEGRRTPWHLTYGAGGLVSKVEEQYIP